MSNTIDNRVVSMQFDNAQFQKGIAQSAQSLKDFNKDLQLNGAADALKGIGNAASNTNGPLSGIAAGVENISSKFSLLGAIGFTIIQDLTNGFIAMGAAMYDAIATPIIQGGEKRATSIEQAKFQFAGLGMNIKKTMEAALYAVKDTAYSLDEAATAASMLGASGVKAGSLLKAALRGISGMAAISGQPYSRLADVVTSVAGQGRVTGDTLFRLGQIGVNAAAILGKALGKSEADIRKMVTAGKIDFATFAYAMDNAFGPHAKEANKTFQGALANTHAALSRLGAVWYGGPPNGENKGIHEAMRITLLALIPIIDGVTTAVTPFLILITEGMKNAAKSFSQFMAVFKTSEGAEAFGHLGNALINIFYGFMSVLGPVKKAFLEVFPTQTIKDFHDFAVGVQDLTNKLFPSKALVEHITIAFKGLFSIFSLAGKGVMFVIDVLRTIFDVLFVSTGIVDTVAGGLGGLSDTIFGFFTMLNSGADTSNIFKNALDILRGGLMAITTPFKFVGGLIETFVGWLGRLGTAFVPATNSMSGFGKVAAVFTAVLQTIGNIITSVFGVLNQVLSPIIAGINRAISTLTFDDVLKTILTFFAAGTLANMSQFFSKFIVIVRGFLPQFSKITLAFKLMLQSFSAQINAQTLKSIAMSVLILAGAMFVISMIDPERLLGATAGIVALLTGVMGIMSQFSKAKATSAKGIIATTVGLNILSGAIITLSLAVLILGKMKPEELSAGLMGVARLLGTIDLFIRFFKTDANLVNVGAGMILFGVALLVMGGALKLIGTMDEGDILKALLTIGGLFAFVIVVNKLIKPSDVAKVGLDMLLLAGAITIMSGAVKLMGSMSIETIGKGLLGLAGGLALMIGALHLMPKDSTAKVADLIIVSAAVYILGLALMKIGSMSMDQLAVSLLGLTLSLLLIEGVLLALSDSKILIGAAALLIVSGALWVLAGVIAAIGLIPVDVIAKSLVTIAAVLAIIALAGLALQEGMVGLFSLGIVILMIGGSIFLAGTGVMMFAAGIAALATAVSIGGPVLLQFLVSLAETLPTLAYNLGLALVAFVKGIVDQSASITASLIGLFNIVLNALITILPQIMNFLGMLFAAILNLLVVQTPLIVNALLTMLMALLTSIVTFMPQISTKGAEIITAFINGISENLTAIITAGTNLIIKFIRGIGASGLLIAKAAMETIIDFVNGLSDAIRTNGKAFAEAANNLLQAIWQALTDLVTTLDFWKIGSDICAGIGKGITDAASNVVAAAGKVASDVWQGVVDFFHIGSPSKLFATIGKALVDGMAVGLLTNQQTAVTAAVNVAKATYTAFADASDKALGVFDTLAPPTIAPVVDLDAVVAGAKAISSLMNNASAVKVAATVDTRMTQTPASSGASTDGTVAPMEVKFEQNNYSPKALSRLEIYRQTRNQLQLLKGLGV